MACFSSNFANSISFFNVVVLRVEVPAYAVRFLSEEIDARVIVLTTILPFLALVALQKILRLNSPNEYSLALIYHYICLKYQHSPWQLDYLPN